MKIAIFLSFLASTLLKDIKTCLGKTTSTDCHTCCGYESTIGDRALCNLACTN
jgi:hypothetical protein